MLPNNWRYLRGDIYYAHVLVDSNPAFEEPSMILLEQIFTIDKSRIERFMGYASKAEMLRIDMALLVSLALNVLSGNRSE